MEDKNPFKKEAKKKERKYRITLNNGTNLIKTTTIVHEEVKDSIFYRPITQHRELSDIMELYPSLALIYDTLISNFTSHSSENPLSLLTSYIPEEYPLILQYVGSIVGAFNEDLDDNKSFNVKILTIAALALHHTNTLVMNIISEFLNAITIVSTKTLEVHFTSLGLLYQFFYAAIKLNKALNDSALLVIEDSIEKTLSVLKSKLQGNFKLLLTSKLQTEKSKLIAQGVYYFLQSVVLVAVFSNSENKESFKEVFNLLVQAAFERICGTEHEFEAAWSFNNNKYILTSLGQKRLSMFIQEDKFENIVKFTLKYMVIYSYYKVCKTREMKLNNLSILKMIYSKNKTMIDKLISQKSNKDNLKLMLCLNENLYIIKNYLINLPETKECIKEAIADYLVLSIKTEMYFKPKSVKDIAELGISKPKDFLSLLFKTLVGNKQVLMKEMYEDIADTVSKLITDDAIYLYRIYYLDFLLHLNTIKGKHIEEIKQYLEETDHKSDPEIIKAMKRRIEELVLEVYAKLAETHSPSLIESTIELIKNCDNKKQKLYKHLHILASLLFKRRLTIKEFEMLLEGDTVIRSKFIIEPSEANAFLNKGGLQVLLSLHKNTIFSYNQVKPLNGTELDFYRRIIELIEDFICVLHYSVFIAKECLQKSFINEDFYLSPQQSLLSKLLKILQVHLVGKLNKEEMTDKFVALVNDVLAHLSQLKTALNKEKLLITNTVNILESLIEESVSSRIMIDFDSKNGKGEIIS